MSDCGFVILAGPRSGSTYLADLLDMAPQTRCLSEIFHRSRVDFRHFEPVDPGLRDIALRDSDPTGFIAKLRGEITGVVRFGFKMIANQQVPLIVDLCESAAWRKIFLWRDDLLEQAISIRLAAEHFGDAEWGRTPMTNRVTIPPEELLGYLHMVQSLYFVLEAALANADPRLVFTLEYRDIGRAATLRRLFRFLGLTPAETKSVLGAIKADEALNYNPGPSSVARVENYAEIRRYFRNSRYRALLSHPGYLNAEHSNFTSMALSNWANPRLR